jgi:hypothetical protein
MRNIDVDGAASLASQIGKARRDYPFGAGMLEVQNLKEQVKYAVSPGGLNMVNATACKFSVSNDDVFQHVLAAH